MHPLYGALLVLYMPVQVTWCSGHTFKVKVKSFNEEIKFTKNIKIFLQLYMIKTDLLTCHQDFVRGGCY